MSENEYRQLWIESMREIGGLQYQISGLQSENARLRAALEADKQKIEQLRETLLLIKVDGEVGQYDYWVYCPWCNEQGYSASIIHADDCQRQAALGLTEAQNG